jgi:hypothetical protein
VEPTGVSPRCKSNIDVHAWVLSGLVWFAVLSEFQIRAVPALKSMFRVGNRGNLLQSPFNGEDARWPTDPSRTGLATESVRDRYGRADADRFEEIFGHEFRHSNASVRRRITR